MYSVSLMVLWIISFFVSLAVIIFANWYEGATLEVSDLVGMALISLIPLLNMVISLALALHVFDNKVILKGRTK